MAVVNTALHRRFLRQQVDPSLIAGIDTRMKVVEQDVGTIKPAVANVVPVVADQVRRVTAIETNVVPEVTNLGTRLTGVQGQLGSVNVANLQKDIDDLKPVVGDLQTQVGGVDVADLLTRLIAVEDQMGTVVNPGNLKDRLDRTVERVDRIIKGKKLKLATLKDIVPRIDDVILGKLETEFKIKNPEQLVAKAATADGIKDLKSKLNVKEQDVREWLRQLF